MNLHARATIEQMKVARTLGIPFTAGITQGEIHLLINANPKTKKKTPPPTPQQICIAKKFGLDFDRPGMSHHYLGDLIIETLLNYFQVDDVIKFEDELYTIIAMSSVHNTHIVHLRSHKSGKVQPKVISAIALAERVE